MSPAHRQETHSPHSFRCPWLCTGLLRSCPSAPTFPVTLTEASGAGPMITLFLDELLRLMEAERATKSLREARAGPELDPRVVCSGLLLSEQGPSLGTRMCLAKLPRSGRGWGRVGPSIPEAWKPRVPPPQPPHCLRLLLCCSACLSVIPCHVCAQTRLLPRRGPGPARFSRSPVLFAAQAATDP